MNRYNQNRDYNPNQRFSYHKKWSPKKNRNSFRKLQRRKNKNSNNSYYSKSSKHRSFNNNRKKSHHFDQYDPIPESYEYDRSELERVIENDRKTTIVTKSGNVYKKSLYSIKYKTKMCEEWERQGYCNYGIKCSFAHSREELR